MTDESVRLDVWLWRARFFKTRALSQTFCESGHVRIERAGKVTRAEKPSLSIRVGDRLLFAIGLRLHDVVVERTGERRGPASEAQGLYRINS